MKRRTARKIVRKLLQGECRWRPNTADKAERIADAEDSPEFRRFVNQITPPQKRGIAANHYPHKP